LNPLNKPVDSSTPTTNKELTKTLGKCKSINWCSKCCTSKTYSQWLWVSISNNRWSIGQIF